MTDIVCISPVDGREVARKRSSTAAEIAAALAAARKAQAQWAELPIAERGRFCSAFVDAMLAMRGDIAPELSWQMGRPIKFAGGELNGFEERARYMIGIADSALAPVEPCAERRLQALCAARAARRRSHHRTVELSLPDGRQFGHPGADGGQCGAAQSTLRRPCWSATASRWRWTAPACRRASFRRCPCRMTIRPG